MANKTTVKNEVQKALVKLKQSKASFLSANKTMKKGKPVFSANYVAIEQGLKKALLMIAKGK